MSHGVIYKVQVIIFFFAHTGDKWHFNASCKGSPRFTFPNNVHHQHHSSQKCVGRFCKNLNIIKEQRQLTVIGKHEVVIQSWRGQLALALIRRSPDVVLVGEDNDHSGVGVLTQPADDLVELPWLGLSGYFHRLGNTQVTWIWRQTRRQNEMDAELTLVDALNFQTVSLLLFCPYVSQWNI